MIYKATTTMIHVALIIALLVLFIHACTWEGMILSSMTELFWKAPVWIKKPLFSCPICMCPWWGSLFLGLFGVFTHYWPHPFVWILEIFLAGGINVVLSSLINPTPNDPYSGGDYQ